MPTSQSYLPLPRLVDDGAELPVDYQRERLLDAAQRSRSGLFLYPFFWLALTHVHVYASTHPTLVIINALLLIAGASGRFYLERKLEGWSKRDFRQAQRAFAWSSWMFQLYWGCLCAYVVGTAELETTRWAMLTATVGLTAGASAIMAIDAPLARWYPPMLLGPTCAMLAVKGGYANWVLAAVFVLFYFYALKIIKLVSGDYEARQRAHVLLEERAKEIAIAHDEMRRLAIYDDLTGLVNRRHMTLLLRRQAELHRQGAAAFSVALVDLDHFKRINDEWRHSVGDEVLQGFAAVARRTLHETEIIARWGGEEFLILLPLSTDNTTEASLERLRQLLADTQIATGAPALRLNFSAGISEHRADEAIEQTIDRADRALYQAKAGGRGRTERV
jgi:diguanylate cyclase (GGDEF)-like protein